MGYFDKFKSNGIPFMEGKEKGNLRDMHGKPVHIADFGFISGEDGEYAVMMFAEDSEHFYFGNSIITEMLHTIDVDEMRNELSQQPIVFNERTSKNGKRTYTYYDFVL